jgi:hypothetical protein
MDTTDNINQILKKFGADISLQNLKLDKNNTCVLVFDGDQSIQITYDEQFETLNFFGMLGDLPEKWNDRCCDCLLKSNADWTLTKGLTLSKRKNSKSILLGYNLPILNLSLEIFENILDHFLKQIDLWKYYIQQMSQGKLPEVLAEL